MVVATFGLDGFDDDSADRVVEVLDEIFCFGKAACFFGHVLLGKFMEGVLEVGERGLRPIEGGDVEFVDWFAAGGGETTEEAAVEGGAEGHN